MTNILSVVTSHARVVLSTEKNRSSGLRCRCSDLRRIVEKGKKLFQEQNWYAEGPNGIDKDTFGGWWQTRMV
jgi:hypothetical protein